MTKRESSFLAIIILLFIGVFSLCCVINSRNDEIKINERDIGLLKDIRHDLEEKAEKSAVENKTLQNAQQNLWLQSWDRAYTQAVIDVYYNVPLVTVQPAGDKVMVWKKYSEMPEPTPLPTPAITKRK